MKLPLTPNNKEIPNRFNESYLNQAENVESLNKSMDPINQIDSEALSNHFKY